MNSKNIIVGFAVIVLLLAVGVVGFYVAQNYRQVILTNPEIHEEPAILAIEDKKITEKADPFNIEIVYPYIAGADDFNQKAEAIVNAQIAEFKKISLENDAAVKETDPKGYAEYPRVYDLRISYEKSLTAEAGQPSPEVVSILFSVSSYTGGAHGANFYIPLNYNLKDKKEITLADVFAGQPDYLKKISDYAIADLNKQMIERLGEGNSAWVADGAGPKEENFVNFLLKEDSITFYFPQYQVAAYAAGSFEVTMSR